MRLSQIYSLFNPHAFSSSVTSDAAQTLAVVGWVPQFRGRRRRVSERTIVKYGDRGVWYVYIAAARPACQIMGVVLSPRLCVRGLGLCVPGGLLLGAGRVSSMIFSRGGRIRVIRCRRWSIRRRFTGRL